MPLKTFENLFTQQSRDMMSIPLLWILHVYGQFICRPARRYCITTWPTTPRADSLPNLPRNRGNILYSLSLTTSLYPLSLYSQQFEITRKRTGKIRRIQNDHRHCTCQLDGS